MSHLTAPLSTQNPRRTSPRPRKATSLAKASTFTAPRCVVIPADSDEEIESLGGEEVDEIMSNNGGFDDSSNISADKKGIDLKAPVLSISRVLTRSHTDTRALENALKEGSRTVDLWERLERLRIDEKNAEAGGREKERFSSHAASNMRSSPSVDKKLMSNRRSVDIESSPVTCSGGGTATPSATSDYGSGSDSDTPSSPTTTKHANPPLSAVACRKIESHILLPLLRRKEVAPFYPLIRSLPPRIQSGEITTLRDLEKTLFGLSVNFAISKAVGRNVYTAFANYTIQCLHAIVPALCERELKSDGERAYSGLYFLDLVEQVRQYAAIVGHARVQRVAAVVKSMEKQLAQGGFKPDDEVVLVNGIANSGRPAELVRRTKDGSMYYLSTGKPYPSDDTSSQLSHSQAKGRSRSSVERPPVDDTSSQQLRAARASIRASRYRNSDGAINALPKRQGDAQSKMGTVSELGTKRALDTTLSVSADEPPNDVSRSMARRKKGEAPMDVKALCRYCNKRFRRPCDLTKHMKTHTRPYKCPEPNCKYFTVGWPTEKERDRHVNDKHSKNPKLYHCEFGCGYQSKRESNCKQHMEKSHAYTYERTKRCSTVKKPSLSGTSVAPMIAAPGGRMGAPSGTPMTPASSSETELSPTTPASGYASSSTPAFDFSRLPTPTGASISGASTTCGGHSSVSGLSTASTPFTVAAASPNFESSKRSGSLTGGSSCQACGQNPNQRCDVHSRPDNQMNAAGFGEGDFSLFTNGDPFAAQGPKPQRDTSRQGPSTGPQANNASVPQFVDAGIPMIDPLATDASAASTSHYADATSSTAELPFNFNDAFTNVLMNCPDVPFDLNDLNNLNTDFATGIDFGNVATSAGAVNANVPNDFAHMNFEPQPYVDNMDVDISEMQQDFAAFYQTLQQNPDAHDPNSLFAQNQSADRNDQCATNMSWDNQQQHQQSHQQYAAQPAVQNLAPLQTPQKEVKGPGMFSSNSSSSSHSERSASLTPPSLGGSPASMASTMSFSEILENTIAAQTHGQNLSQEARSSFIKGIFANYDGSSAGSRPQVGNGSNEYGTNLGSNSGNDPANLQGNSQISFNDEEFVTYSTAGSQSQSHGNQQRRHLDFTLYDTGFVPQLNGPNLQTI